MEALVANPLESRSDAIDLENAEGQSPRPFDTAPTLIVDADGGASPIHPPKAGKPKRVKLDCSKSKPPKTLRKGVAKKGFELRDMIGKGGMGRIYRARQKSVDRDIAVKLINPKYFGDDEMRRIFVREAVVTGCLDHPNIIPVHEVCELDDGGAFYVMKEIQGTPWNKVAGEQTIGENLEILLKVGDALAFAHDRGVIHRDIKPENVMLGGFGEVLLLDWGIAAGFGNGPASDKAARLDANSDIEGTPQYMAPETVVGDPTKLDHRSDIYLLGATLFELITGKKPHGGPTIEAIVHAAAENVIQPTDKDGELIDIALKAMATDPEDRYQSVKEFQQAIRNFQAHAESLALTRQAREDLSKAYQSEDYNDYAQAMYGFREALSLWTDNDEARVGLSNAALDYAERAYVNGDYDLALSLLDEDDDTHRASIEKTLEARRKRVAKQKHVRMLIYASCGLIGVIIIILSGAYVIIQKERNEAIFARDKAIQAEAKAKRLLTQKELENYYNSVNLAKNKIVNGQFQQARKILESAPDALRGWEWGLLMDLINPARMVLKEHHGPVRSVAFSEDGRVLLSVGDDGQVILWGTKTWKPMKTIGTEKDRDIGPAHVSPDGSRVAFAVGEDLVLYDARDGSHKVLSGLSGRVRDVAFSPDRTHVAAVADDGSAIIWTMKTGEVYRRFKGRPGPVLSIAFSPGEGRRVVTGGANGEVFAWTVESENLRQIMRGHESPVTALAFSPNGDFLASAADGGEIRLWKKWETKSSAETVRIFKRHEGTVNALAFSSDSQRLASVGDDGTARIWSVRGGDELKILREAGSGAVLDVDFSPDDRYVVAGTANQAVIFWDAENALTGSISGRVVDEKIIPRQSTTIGDRSVKLRLDGGVVTLGDAYAGGTFLTLSGHADEVRAATFSLDGRRVATAAKDKTIKLWDTGNGREILTLPSRSEDITAIAFANDGERLLVKAADGSINAWKADKW